MPPNKLKPLFWIYCLSAIVICRLAAHYVFPILDDAYITFRYARNLAIGLGFVYNAGELVQGVTCPGFGFLLAGCYLLGANLPAFVPLLNIAIDALAFFIVVKYFLTDFDASVIGLFCLLFAVSPVCNYVCVGGMETNLFILFSLLAIFFFTTDRQILAISIASTATYLRPEEVLLVLLLFFRLLYQRSYRKAAISALSAGIIALIYLTLSYKYYGSFLPQSLLAKSGATGDPIHFTILRLLFIDYLGYLLLPLAIIGVTISRKNNRNLALFSEWILLYLLSYLIARPIIPSWYTLPVQFSLLVFAAIGMGWLGRRFFTWWNRVNSIPIAVYCGLAILLWGGVVFVHGEQPSKKLVFRPMQEFLTHSNLSGKEIVAYDIGTLGYYSNAKIYDMAGLVSPSAAKYNDLKPVVDSLAPDYIMLSAKKSEIEQMQPDQLGKLYYPIQRFSIFGDTNSSPDYRILPEAYNLDYIIYQKRFSATENGNK